MYQFKLVSPLNTWSLDLIILGEKNVFVVYIHHQFADTVKVFSVDTCSMFQSEARATERQLEEWGLKTTGCLAKGSSDNS